MLIKKLQTGVTMIELLIGLLAGSIVMAGAVALLTSNIKGNADTSKLMRLNQDLRAMMDIMVRDIRRAGFVTDDPVTDLALLKANPFFDATNDVAIYEGGSCIVYAYNRNADSEDPRDVDDNERLGFGLTAGDLKMRKSGTNNGACWEGSWETITEPEVRITALSFSLTQQTLNIASMIKPLATGVADGDVDADGVCDGKVGAVCPNDANGLCDAGEVCNTCVSGLACLYVRDITIVLTGQLKDDTNVTQTITEQVRIRNDKIATAP